MNVLEVNDLHVDFGTGENAVHAVRGVSFRIPAGKTVALVGESGSGKSVISQSILRILPRTGIIKSGEIALHDPVLGRDAVDLAKLPANGNRMRGIRGGRISIIFQEPMTSLSPLHTIGDQVNEALRLHDGASEQAARRHTIDMLDMVGFPNSKRAFDMYPFELSGGLRQRAMIAMALVCRPSLLIADEPTTALDVTVQAQILKLVSDLQDELGMAILMITHDLGVVANMADEVVVMYHGRVMESGTQEDIFRNPQHPYLQALMNAVPKMGMGANERLTPLREIKTDTERLMGAPRNNGSDEIAADGTMPPLLSVEGVSRSFSIRKKGLFGGGSDEKVFAVQDVSLDVKRGECVGLVGESGCGKTTMSKMIMRALTPDSGRVLYRQNGEARDVHKLSPADLKAYRRRVQFIFQDPFSSLDPRMTVFDILSEPLVIHEIGTPAERAETVKTLMSLVGLDPRQLRRYPHSFSGGQRQRIGIARALALGPDLLICDEPVSALDVSVQAQILNLLKDLKAQLGLTYLFVSHNLAVVDYIADRIAVMCRGRLVETAPKADLFANPRHPYTRALLAAVPEPDLDRKLDLTALMAGRASEPEAWPMPFGDGGDGGKAELIEVAPGHLVRTLGPMGAAA